MTNSLVDSKENDIIRELMDELNELDSAKEREIMVFPLAYDESGIGEDLFTINRVKVSGDEYEPRVVISNDIFWFNDVEVSDIKPETLSRDQLHKLQEFRRAWMDLHHIREVKLSIIQEDRKKEVKE